MEIKEDSFNDEPSFSLTPYLFVLFYLIAVYLVIKGFTIAYTDSDYKNSIVGGDAYNYIIFAGRGAVWVGAAIVTAIIGLGLQISGHIKNYTNVKSSK